MTAGAQSTTASIPATSTWAVIGVCMYNDTALQPPTSVTLAGQAATLIDSAGTTSTLQVALYKVTGFATGAGKTLAYTVGASGTFFALNFAIEYRTGTPTYGAHASASTADFGPTSTSAIANTSGDELIAVYCSKDNASSPTMGTGQTKLDDTDDTTGLAWYGITTETGSGASDVQTVAAGGTGNIPAIAAVAVTLSSPAGFTTGPTYSKVDNNTLRATFTCNSGTPVARIGLYAWGASAPSGTQVAAGTNARGTASAMCTGSSQTLDVDTSDSPAFPKYDPYMTLDSSGVYTTPPATSTTQLDPPTTCGASSNQACQYVTLSSVAIGGVAAVATLAYDGQTANFVVGETVTGGTSGAIARVQSDSDSGATGTLTLWVSSGTFQNNEAITGNIHGIAVVNGTATYLYAANDVLVATTYVSPAGASYPLTIAADGTAVYDAYAYDANVGEETATNIKVYDYSAVGYASGDIDWSNNHPSPTCSGGVLSDSLTLNAAMSALDLDLHCAAASGTLSSAVIGTLPTGLSHNGATNVTSGTPTVEDTTGVSIRYVVTDASGAVNFKDVFFTVATTWTVPDCVSTATTADACVTSLNTLTSSAVRITSRRSCSTTGLASGKVISQLPAAGVTVVAGDTEELNISTGRCGDVAVPNCLAKTQSQCLALVVSASQYAGLSSSCAANDTVYSQTPAARSKAAYNFTLTALCH